MAKKERAAPKGESGRCDGVFRKALMVIRRRWSMSWQRWRRLSRFRQNLAVGLLIALSIHLAHDTGLVRGSEDLAVDWMNRLQVDTDWLNASSRGSPPTYTLIDMDEKTFKAWKEPFYVPRDRLARLIHYAATGGARAIIVDVDISRPGTELNADEALRRVVAEYPPSAPDLLLMRTLEPPGEGGDGVPRWRHTILDESTLSAAVHWVHPRFNADPQDHTLRRWRLVEFGCLEGRPRWLPSAQLLVDILLTDGRDGWQQVQAQLRSFTPPTCDEEFFRQPIGPERVSYGAAPARKTVVLNAHGVHQRVIYSYTYPTGNSRNPVPTGLIILRAERVLQDVENKLVDLVRNRIVTIGASYTASRDLHHTPVGEMPGALVLLNAVKSLHQFGQLRGPNNWIKLLLEIPFILVMAYAFARFDSLRAVLFSGISVILILVPASFWLFRYGIWIDLAAPILGMQAHDLWADIEEMQDARRASKAPARGTGVANHR